MTSHVARLYALAVGLLVFFVAWAAVAAHPWKTSTRPPQDPRLCGAPGPRAPPPGGVAGGQADRRPALGRLSRPPGRPQTGDRERCTRRTPGRAPWPRPRSPTTGGSAPVGAHRHAAAADDHEDVVMLRRTFPAMGTQVELLLDAEPSAESELAFARAEREFERLEALLSRFRPDSELSALNRLGALDAGEDLVAVTRSARSRRASGPAADSTRPSTTRSSRPATTARSTR